MGFSKNKHLGGDVGFGNGRLGFSGRPSLEGLDKIFSDYGFLNMWSSENLDISGTTTTMLDYAGEHDLVNPAATNQPTFNASGFGTESKPSLSYDGIDDYNYKAVANWRGSDTTGVFISVFKDTGGSINNVTLQLCTSDELSNNDFFFQQKWNNGSRMIIRKSGLGNSYYGDLGALRETQVTSNGSNGFVYKSHYNGVAANLTILAGTDNGDWLDKSINRDNISIGAKIGLTSVYGGIELAMSGYLPYTNDADIVNLHNELKSYYGIV